MAARECGWCGKAIYYGLYCSNDCSDKGFVEWKAEQARLEEKKEKEDV